MLEILMCVALLGATEAPNYFGEVKAEAQKLVNKTIDDALKDEAQKERPSKGG